MVVVEVYVPTPEAKIRWDGFLISACQVLTALKQAADEIAVTSGDPDRASVITTPINTTLSLFQVMEVIVRQKFDK